VNRSANSAICKHSRFFSSEQAKTADISGIPDVTGAPKLIRASQGVREAHRLMGGTNDKRDIDWADALQQLKRQ